VLKLIERKFINQKIKEFEIKEYVKSHLARVGLSDVKLQRTPLGEKIIVSTSRPGLVVGRSGVNISKLTKDLKQNFGLENPQIEIEEVASVGLDANIIAEMIANSLEKFGLARFKGIGHKAMQDVMGAGALGVEILMSGKIPSARARTWRFYQGYLKKCGDIAVSQVKVAYSHADLKSGTVGIKVSIMTPDIKLPDQISVKKQEDVKAEGEEASSKEGGGAVDDKIKALLKEGEMTSSEKEKQAESSAKKGKKERKEKADKTDKPDKAEKTGKTDKKQAKQEPKKKDDDVKDVKEESPQVGEAGQ
jgi:small subunit ribosomal protein S3